jgi:signal transduction histidine kinase
MLLSACAILLLVVVDAILLATVTQQRDLAFFLSAVIGITAYLPMREWILRRAERMRDGQSRDLMQFATEMALAPSPQAATQAWQSAVIAMFEPLEVEAAPCGSGRPEVMENGSALYFPSPTADGALLLRYPGGGTRIFAASDLDIVLQFTALVGHLLDARDAYLRGVTEERGRIARDLHDDVSARLLTSLHRTDPEAMHDDVRSAMADIRTIVTGLSGAPLSFASTLANLRHETQIRLEAAGIVLDWPILSDTDEAIALDYSSGRHVVSVVRECVSNIIRHAEASSARILISRLEDQIVIDIEDDGRGNDADTPTGNGLANAHRRAASMGGTFELKKRVIGSHACLIVPLASSSARREDSIADPSVSV